MAAPLATPSAVRWHIVIVVFLCLVQFGAMLVGFVASAGEPDPTMTPAEVVHADQIERRIMLSCAALVVILFAVQVAVAASARRVQAQSSRARE